MQNVDCRDIVRFGADTMLAPPELRDGISAHVDSCPACSVYTSQMDQTRRVLGEYAGRRDATEVAGSAPLVTEVEAQTLRTALLSRAELLDPQAAEDLADEAFEVGLALAAQDKRMRTEGELVSIMHTLYEAQQRFDSGTIVATDLDAASHERHLSLDDLDPDADNPQLFYPKLYPVDDELSDWADGPRVWASNSPELSPEALGDLDDVDEVLDSAINELPEPLGELLDYVDLSGADLDASAHMLGLSDQGAAAGLARARNHVRGRLDEYLSGGGQRREPTTV